MYRIEFSENADADMMNVSNYIFDESGSVELATKIIVNMVDSIRKRLENFPNSGIVELYIAK